MLHDAASDTHQQVLWLDVSVDDVEDVQVFDGTGQVEQHPTGISLCVLVGGRDGVEQISALTHTCIHTQTEKERKKESKNVNIFWYFRKCVLRCLVYSCSQIDTVGRAPNTQ